MKLSRLAPPVALALTLAVLGIALPSHAVGPGGWDRLGIDPGGTQPALNGDVLAMNTTTPGVLLAGGKFTHAGGVTGADRVASWNGTSWSAVGPPSSFDLDVHALAVAGGKIYAGGVFHNAGGDADADFLAVYDGVSWKHFCVTPGTPLNGSVLALQVVDNSLYVGGTFLNAAGIPTADNLIRCDLTTGTPSTTTTDPAHPFGGPVYALTSDSAGHLYAGGGFSNLENNPASDDVAMLSGGAWTNLGSGGGPCGCAVDSFVRSLADDGTTLYVGADSNDIAGIIKADHVAAWNGSSWHALGANSAATDGYFPAAVTEVHALFTVGSHVYAGGIWTNVGGDPTADYLADFDGSSWKPIGSNGAGNGAINAHGESFAVYGGVLHVGGGFTQAGGDDFADFLARYVGIVPPSNVITVGKAKANKANGTAKLSIGVPGAGALTLSGKGIKGLKQASTAAGTVVLKIKPKSKTMKKLRAKGKVKVMVTVTFTPTGGTAKTETKKVKLVLHRS